MLTSLTEFPNRHTFELYLGAAVDRARGTRESLAVAYIGLAPHLESHAGHVAMQAGVNKWEAAGSLGMTVETLERVYGHHHHSDWQKRAAEV